MNSNEIQNTKLKILRELANKSEMEEISTNVGEDTGLSVE